MTTPNLSIGHVHLKVSNLESSIDFYTRVLGLEVMQLFGTQAAFLGAGGYHHHLGLNTWHSKDADPAPRHAPGLYHTAFLYPDRAALGQAISRLKTQGVTLEGAADHGVSEAVYFSDPDGNGIELYRDRPRDDWPLKADGSLSMTNDPLDVDALIAEGLADA